MSKRPGNPENWFLARRRELGLTQSQIADICGVSGAQISYYESFRALPKISGDIERVASAYGMTTEGMIAKIVEISRCFGSGRIKRDRAKLKNGVRKV